MTGGRLYVAGLKNLLGASFPSFGELGPMVIKSVAAGSSHQVFISQSVSYTVGDIMNTDAVASQRQ